MQYSRSFQQVAVIEWNIAAIFRELHIFRNHQEEKKQLVRENM